jgi:hypothetical protein
MPASFVDIVGYALPHLLDVSIQPGDECLDDRTSSKNINGEFDQFVHTQLTDLVVAGPDREMPGALDSNMKIARSLRARLGVEIEEVEISVALIYESPETRAGFGGIYS